MSEKTIQEVKEGAEKGLMALPGVTGVGIGLSKDRRETCIKVFVNQQVSASETRIPNQIEGYRVEVVVRGSFRALE